MYVKRRFRRLVGYGWRIEDACTNFSCLGFNFLIFSDDLCHLRWSLHPSRSGVCLTFIRKGSSNWSTWSVTRYSTSGRHWAEVSTELKPMQHTKSLSHRAPRKVKRDVNWLILRTWGTDGGWEVSLVGFTVSLSSRLQSYLDINSIMSWWRSWSPDVQYQDGMSTVMNRTILRHHRKEPTQAQNVEKTSKLTWVWWSSCPEFNNNDIVHWNQTENNRPAPIKRKTGRVIASQKTICRR